MASYNYRGAGDQGDRQGRGVPGLSARSSQTTRVPLKDLNEQQEPKPKTPQDYLNELQHLKEESLKMQVEERAGFDSVTALEVEVKRNCTTPPEFWDLWDCLEEAKALLERKSELDMVEILKPLDVYGPDALNQQLLQFPTSDKGVNSGTEKQTGQMVVNWGQKVIVEDWPRPVNQKKTNPFRNGTINLTNTD